MQTGARVVAVVGSGLTVPPIAAAFATIPGTSVSICARREDAARDAAAVASGLTGQTVGARPLAADAFADVDVVVESIAEDLEGKRQLLATIERWVSDDVLIATNTSSLPLASIADSLQRPGRFGGLHFLHPAHETGVVEVIAAPATEPATLAALGALVRAMAKRPIVLRKAEPGFLWNRLQFALLRECAHLLDEGIANADEIDAAISEGLAPRWLAAGPLATMELGGAQTFVRIAEQLNPHLAAEPTVSPSLRALAAGGAGFYAWDDTQRRDVERLRAEALVVGRTFAQRRQQIDAGDPQT